MKLDDNIRYLKGIGEKRAELFGKLGIKTVRDLLYHFPRGYEDRSEIASISDLVQDETVCVCANVIEPIKTFRTRRRMLVSQTRVSDGTGVMKITWFNAPYIQSQIKGNGDFVFFGKVNFKGNIPEMTNPVVETGENSGKKTGRIMPVYPCTAGLSQRNIREAAEIAVRVVAEQLTETIPDSVREKYNLMPINDAIRHAHSPENFDDFEAARRRLAFEEFLVLQLGISSLKYEKVSLKTKPITGVGIVRDFADGLNFELTGAQKRVINEICADLKKDVPMNRLIQGDVGSGKTIVAAAAMFAVAKAGMQSAMMAPTEILAEQHYKNLASLFSPWGIETAFLSGGQSASERKENLKAIESGRASVIVGTHAIITEKVGFDNLALTVTDEQHRFGVRQRNMLGEKGYNPHTLVMTATPIPRTLSLVIYGDLDVSIIDELPPGRQKTDTFAMGDGMRERVNDFIRKKLDEGRQAYFVCPLVEESEVLDAKAAAEYVKNLRQGPLKGYRVELIHGKMKAAEKEKVMRKFAAGEISALVATTVIEVGIDVPNATIMVIENAERFGLSQLHQLRGRVGRGEHRSYCVMFSKSTGGVAYERMKVMCETSDGFKIAEKDLEIRGPGEFFGMRQHGLPEMRVANFFTDMDILKETQAAAKEITAKDPFLMSPKLAELKRTIKDKFENIGGSLN